MGFDAIANGGTGNGKNGGFSAIYNFITATLVMLVVLLLPLIYAQNQSIARLQSQQDGFVYDLTRDHEELEYTRRQLSQTIERAAALEQAVGLRLRQERPLQ